VQVVSSASSLTDDLLNRGRRRGCLIPSTLKQKLVGVPLCKYIATVVFGTHDTFLLYDVYADYYMMYGMMSCCFQLKR
jgi:hypothetical protein